MKRFWRAETGIFLAIWLLLLVGGRSRFFRDPGTFWHTVTGERILASHHAIDLDPYSFTFASRHWVAYEWLGEILMAILHAFGGFDALLLAAVTFLAALYAWIAHRLIRAGFSGLLAFAVVMLALAASMSHFHVRPHLLTIGFLAWTFAKLLDFEAGRTSLRKLFWLVPLFVLWTNIHGGMLGGLGTMVVAFGGWCFIGLFGLTMPLRDRGQVLGFAALLLACALTSLVNPYGVREPITWLELMNAPEIPRLVKEHAPLAPSSVEGVVVLAFGFLYVIVLSGLRSWPRVTWLIPIVWLVLSCMRIRHSPLFAVTAALAVADVWPETRWADLLKRTGSDLYTPVTGAIPARFPWKAAILPILAVVGAVLAIPLFHPGWARIDPEHWPTGLIDELKTYEREKHDPPYIFNDFDFGGFLIYYTPGLKVYVDDRCEVYGGPWLEELARSRENHPQRIEDWSRYWGFDRALVRTGSGFDNYLRTAHGWVEVAHSGPATLYRKLCTGEARDKGRE